MYKYAWLACLFNRRKDVMPAVNERRKPTRKQSSEILHTAISNFEKTVARACGDDK